MSDTDGVSPLDELRFRMAGESLVVEFFTMVDQGDLDGALALYAADAVFLGSRSRAEIRATMERGLAANAGRRSRHVVGNLRSQVVDDTVMVRFTNVAYTIDDTPGQATGGAVPRSVLDQEMVLRTGETGMRIAEHRIFDYELP